MQRSKNSVWRRRSLPERALVALRAAAACAAGLVVLYLLAFVIGPARSADTRVLEGFLSLRTPRVDARAGSVIRLFDYGPYAVAVVLVLAGALWRGGLRLAAAVAAIVFGAGLTTQFLKLLTAGPRAPLWLDDASWPSGHVTAAAALALSVVLIAPPVLRSAAAAAGGLGVLATAYSILVVGSHHPSDVLGGMLMAGLWTSLAVAGLELTGAAPAAAGPRALWPAPAAALVAVAGLLGVVSAVEPLGTFVSDHTTMVAGAIALAACGAALPAVAAEL
jgi:membrane-associated phospholipid phosphatase